MSSNSAKQKWVGAIVGLLVANLIATVLLIVAANGSHKSHVMPSYTGVTKK